MSRQIVSNQGDLAQIIDNRFTTDCRNPHRMLIVIELAPPLWLENYARSSQIKFISADTLADRADQISALLGQEHEILAHSLNEPMDAGLLAALAGTVTHSGVLILSFPDRAVLPVKGEDFGKSGTSHFSARFSKLLNAAEKDHPAQFILLRVSEDPKNSTLPPAVPLKTKAVSYTHLTLPTKA